MDRATLPTDPLVLQARALRTLAQAMRQQLDGLAEAAGALVAVLEAEERAALEGIETGVEGACPRCGAGVHQAQAGDVTVCGHCGANHRNGEVIGG